MTTDQAIEWTHVDKGLPPCDGRTVFIGINYNGHCGHFNNFFKDKKVGGTCTYDIAEKTIETMSDLKYWKKLDMPKVKP